jgi:hypothetical protein
MSVLSRTSSAVNERSEWLCTGRESCDTDSAALLCSVTTSVVKRAGQVSVTVSVSGSASLTLQVDGHGSPV